MRGPALNQLEQPSLNRSERVDRRGELDLEGYSVSPPRNDGANRTHRQHHPAVRLDSGQDANLIKVIELRTYAIRSKHAAIWCRTEVGAELLGHSLRVGERRHVVKRADHVQPSYAFKNPRP
ncbi:hypothetical protein [Methylobacterium sp. J-076]|uniref:hypothetical protein n=1 Tax=Methylobacterium sp. J-076 TaxID=2836655 RepID=UPI001FBACB9A|nr:hypothetical protein [Methylobacterium sp. J-076]MCJ2011502.1 hypothetical protein [Methylobacterium sp. J-076]